jgi:heme-degrading monooxygenase HmoA
VDDVKWASGQWHVKEGKAEEFVTRWTSWLTWTSENIPGFRSARLLRSEDDALRFVSVSDWDDDAHLKAWKVSPGFREKIERVKELCDGFVGGDFEVAALIMAPALRA